MKTKIVKINKHFPYFEFKSSLISGRIFGDGSGQFMAKKTNLYRTDSNLDEWIQDIQWDIKQFEKVLEELKKIEKSNFTQQLRDFHKR